MNRLKLLAAAMLLAAPIACGDEVPPPPPTGSIDGLVSIEGQGIDAVSVTLSNGASATTGERRHVPLRRCRGRCIHSNHR